MKLFFGSSRIFSSNTPTEPPVDGNDIVATVTPTITQLNHDGFAVQGSIDRAANIYIKNLANGSPAPSSATVKASPTASVLNTSVFVLNVTGLSEDTEYDVYVTFEDLLGNLSASPTKIDVRTPVNLATIFGSNLRTLINTRSSSGKTLSGLGNRKCTAFTAEGADTVAFSQTSSNAAISPGWNGKSFAFRELTGFKTSSLNKFNYLHNGSAFTIAFGMILAAAPAEGITMGLINDNSNQTANIGFGLTYVYSGGQHLAVATITKGSSVLSLTIPLTLTMGVRATFILKYSGGTSAGTATLIAEKDGVQVASGQNIATHSTSDSTHGMAIGRRTNQTIWAQYLSMDNIAFIDRACTTEELETLRSWLNHGESDLGVGPEGDLHCMGGQSNMAGKPTAGLPSYLVPATGAFMFNRTETGYNGQEKWAPHLYGTNANTENEAAFGPDMEFAYRMNLLKPGQIWILKLAVSGSAIKLISGANNDWSMASAATDPGTTFVNEAIKRALFDLKYEHDRTIMIRSFCWRQGESDTTAPNDYYEGGMNDLLAAFTSKVEERGESVALCRFVASQLDGLVPARGAGCQNIVDQTLDVANSVVANHGFKGGHVFSTSNTTNFPILPDGTHFGVTGMISQGGTPGFYGILGQYINEV